LDADVDVAIVGAGPAGACVALNLAPFRRVLLLDRTAVPHDRIGDSLPGAARRLLTDMGLWDGFRADPHLPAYSRTSVWGGTVATERDALADPDGHGWHLDRARFERRLRAVAAARGARLEAPARVLSLARERDRWRLEIDLHGLRVSVRARMIVDAGGRGSRLLSDFGARRRSNDRLICTWMRARTPGASTVRFHIEAEPDGWWYSASLPHGETIVAFHTDADLPAARTVRSAEALRARASRFSELREIVAHPAWSGAEKGVCAANGASLISPIGGDWIAAGDAALSFDPLAAQGLFNALCTGLAAAESIDRHLRGDTAALAEYAQEIATIRNAYEAHVKAWYGLEVRWSANTFWSRRAMGQVPGRRRTRG
jgi:flavin-dependent dehydrogenase